MPRGVHQVKLIFPAVRCGIGYRNRLAFYRNPPFPFYIHVVEDLILKIPVLHQMALLDKPVRQGGLAVINMGDYAKVAD
jgi:hypothetical protein